MQTFRLGWSRIHSFSQQYVHCQQHQQFAGGCISRITQYRRYVSMLSNMQIYSRSCLAWYCLLLRFEAVANKACIFKEVNILGVKKLFTWKEIWAPGLESEIRNHMFFLVTETCGQILKSFQFRRTPTPQTSSPPHKITGDKVIQWQKVILYSDHVLWLWLNIKNFREF